MLHQGKKKKPKRRKKNKSYNQFCIVVFYLEASPFWVIKHRKLLEFRENFVIVHKLGEREILNLLRKTILRRVTLISIQIPVQILIIFSHSLQNAAASCIHRSA